MMIYGMWLSLYDSIIYATQDNLNLQFDSNMTHDIIYVIMFIKRFFSAMNHDKDYESNVI